MRGGRDNRLARWAVYNLAAWIVKREVRRRRRKLIALGVLGLVLAGGAAIALRPQADER
jgi:hypothetical protein